MQLRSRMSYPAKVFTMKNWIKRFLGFFSKKERTYEDDEFSLFCDDPLPGKPVRDPRPAARSSSATREENVRRPAKRKYGA